MSDPERDRQRAGDELERVRKRAEARERIRRRERRAIVFLALILFVAGFLILVEQARARPPVPPAIYKAVRHEWRNPADRRKAFDVVACETGNTYDLGAANGQYLGIFQMGARERRICGHGWTARAQARAARCWYDKTGGDWQAWSCA